MSLLFETEDALIRSFYTNHLVFTSHLHENPELILVLDGTITVCIDQQIYSLCAGDFAIIFPNTIHSYIMVEENKDSRTLLNICNLKLCSEYVKTLSKYQPAIPIIRKSQLHPNVAYAMTEIYEEWTHNGSEKVCRALVTLILSRILPVLELAKTKDPDSYDLPGRIVRYIREHYQEPLTLSSLADSLHVSKYYLSHTFSAKMNTGFSQYLMDIRLNYAADLIHSTDLKLTDIWISCGFESQRSFNRNFKQVFRVSPREYRKSEHV